MSEPCELCELERVAVRSIWPCEWCGSPAVADGSTCPKAVGCPTCFAGAGESCRRPSGHRAATLHARRVRLAESLPAPAQLGLPVSQ